MKYVIIILMAALLMSCEKDTCIECSTTIRGKRMVTTYETTIICGKYTNREIEKIKSSTVTTNNGVTTSETICNEQ